MEIKELSISELTPYANNPRQNDGAVDAVKASIAEFGFKVPIVIDKDGVIVAGHTRLKAAKALGLESVPCVVADDLTDEQIRAFRLADNKVAELATWDLEKLDLEMSEIDLKMESFGFVNFGGESDVDSFSDMESEDDGEFGDIEKMEKHYGVPYRGNKSRIADIIISILPSGKRLVDLFGGGGCDYALRDALRKVGCVSV